MAKTALLVVDLVVVVGATPSRAFEPGAELDGLDRVDRHHGLGEPAVELAVPVHVAPEPRWEPARYDAKRASDRVAKLADLVDQLDHLAGGLRVGAAHRGQLDVVLGHEVAVDALEADVDRADRLREAQDLDAEPRQELARHAPRRDAGRRLARGRPLEDVADVGVAVLQGAGEVRVPRAQAGHDLRLIALLRG